MSTTIQKKIQSCKVQQMTSDVVMFRQEPVEIDLDTQKEREKKEKTKSERRKKHEKYATSSSEKGEQWSITAIVTSCHLQIVTALHGVTRPITAQHCRRVEYCVANHIEYYFSVASQIIESQRRAFNPQFLLQRSEITTHQSPKPNPVLAVLGRM